ncbi:MAG: PQQ-binding-like beta-propeller repeat protein, partial [Acidimicrobiales bacterium]
MRRLPVRRFTVHHLTVRRLPVRRLPVRRVVVFAAASTCAAVGLAGCSSSPGPARSAPASSPATSTTTTSSSTTMTQKATTTTSAPPAPSLGSVAWKAAVDGSVYAQPVVEGNRVFVATEDDGVYALSLQSGKVLWHASIGTPLSHVDTYAGCGDIDPLGITSTPVADAADDTLYVVGEISNGADPPVVHRELVGFD